MIIQLNNDLKTGINNIDGQHKELINRINGVIDASEGNIDKGEIDSLVRYLGGFIIYHFKAEEEYMLKYEYPDYDTMKTEHMKFLKNFTSLKRLCEEEESLEVIMLAIKNQVIHWLEKHIINYDKKMAAFFREYHMAKL